MIKKMLPWLVIVLVAITLIAVAALLLWEFVIKEPKPLDPALAAQSEVSNEQPVRLNAEQVKELTVMMEKITTNLSDSDHVVLISFAFQLSNKKAKAEFESIRHLAQAAVIKALADTSPEDIQGSKGQDLLISRLMNAINPLLQQGKVSKIDITEFLLTRI
jgi:flagellar FliL protein